MRLQDMTLDQLWARLRERYPGRRIDVTEDHYACSVTIGLGDDEAVFADHPHDTWTTAPDQVAASPGALRACLTELLGGAH